MTALVIKFGGDALATPERIAAAAHRVARRRTAGPVIAVTSARRGVTDHLLGLVDQVHEAGGQERRPTRAALAAADRAVTSGEVVTASLLAVALEGLGIPAAVLDAREAGLRSDGTPGEAAIVAVRPARLERLIRRGTVPVVTGFQGWHRGRLTALGRGGSDITAVALAGALHAESCELVKDPGALHTADPRLVPEARPIPVASHRFVAELAAAGARVVHHAAAAWADREAIPLRFTSLRPDGEPATTVTRAVAGQDLQAVVLAPGAHGVTSGGDQSSAISTVSVVRAVREPGLEEELRAAASGAGVRILGSAAGPYRCSFLVPADQGRALLRTLHAVLHEDDPERRRHAASR